MSLENGNPQRVAVFFISKHQHHLFFLYLYKISVNLCYDKK